MAGGLHTVIRRFVLRRPGMAAGTPAEISAGMASGEFVKQGNPFEEIFPGMVERINSDDDLVKVDPSRPGSTFAPFVEASLRAIAAALNYPYELLAKNFFRTTYSSGRLAMLDARIGFRMRAQAMIHQVLKPLWRRIVDDAFFYGHMEEVTDVLVYTQNSEEFHDHSWGGVGGEAARRERKVKWWRDFCLDSVQRLWISHIAIHEILPTMDATTMSTTQSTFVNWYQRRGFSPCSSRVWSLLGGV